MKWQDYAFCSKSHTREETEWSITYAYNTQETSLPRVLLIGDSICNAYQEVVHETLAGKVNVSFWASSKCVTDKDYIRELDYILDAYPYDMITFNNGLHSLYSDRGEWDEAYILAISYIQKKLPDVKLSLVLSTPLKDPKLTAVSASLNKTVRAVAEELALPVVDLFAAMEPLDREAYWRDVFHYTKPGVDLQGKILSNHVLERLQIG